MTDADREEVQEWIRQSVRSSLRRFEVPDDLFRKLCDYACERYEYLGESLTTYGYTLRLGGKLVVPYKADDHAAFLAAIVARPDDDLPRLIYADYLDERGEAERAEFIRVQCDIARWKFPGECPKRREYRAYEGPAVETRCGKCRACGEYRRETALRRRERELLSKQVRNGNHWNWQEWGNPAASFLRPYGMPDHHPELEFRRGFVEEITCSWENWRTHADAIRAATPLRKVKLTTWLDGAMLAAFMNSASEALQVLYPGIEFELPRPRQPDVQATMAAYRNLLDQNIGNVRQVVDAVNQAWAEHEPPPMLAR